MNTWEMALGNPTDGYMTFDKWKFSDNNETSLRWDRQADRSPFSEQVFVLGTGKRLPQTIALQVTLRGADMDAAEQLMANAMYVLSIATEWHWMNRVKTIYWTGNYSRQPTFNTIVLTFELTTTEDWAAFSGELTDIADPPEDPAPYNPTTVSLSRVGQGAQVHYSPTKYSYTASFATANAGDLMVMMLVTTYASYTLPAGFTVIQTFTQGSFYGVIASKIATGGETSFTGVAGLNPTPNNWILGWAIFRDLLAGTELAIYDSLYNTGTAQNFVPPLTDIGVSLGHERWIFAWHNALASFQPATQPKILDQANFLGGHTLTAFYPIDENVNRQTTSGAYHTYMITIGAADSIVIPISPDPDSDPDPTPEPGIVNALPALGDFQARSGAGDVKVSGSQFTRPYRARNRTFDAGSPSSPLHPSTGFMNIRSSSSQPIYFFCVTEIFQVTAVDTTAGTIAISSRGSNGLGAPTYDRHFQWSRVAHNQYYGVRNGDLLRFTVGNTTPTVLCSRARVLSELGLTAYDSEAVRWGGPSEGTIVSNTAGLGKEIAGGYVRTGEKALTVFAYNVTDDTILSTVQNITFTTEAGLYFDFIATSVRGTRLYMKPRPQESSINADYWQFPITLSGVGSRVLINLDVGHSSAGLRVNSGAYEDAYYTFYSEVVNIVGPAGTVALTKAIEGQWSEHIGHVYGTPFFTSYDQGGRAAMEHANGLGGYGLGEGWDAGGYVQAHYDAPTGDVFVIGLRGGVPELRYWDA